ncbi:MAG TPA: GDP-mannose 4,6-dehydratase [Planctomycetota bacterium]|jgi:UDP-glucuronate 4-epimerase|nr:GDP-mannose 4,6-dehydratase [Planctomycetota bacterium]OQC21591.1 MAG: UDP-glucose 4-epimerase [Planctomycetes bacterium ADurb.Bin069]HNR98543.1 GDP-mannose 4,6-dehydratase [Planctomycetota bacterium]HNU26895.1 GDP-mannose 4,6-dehydratase [Planctomycetota bacterium]HOE28767.1 GDP-mannose 4,6-dehydratase [Planctomycetota bacterium]
MRVCITGAAGFIGSWTARALLARGDEVIGIDNFDPYYDRAHKERNLAELRSQGRFAFAETDIRAPETAALVAHCRPDVLVHLAARPGVRASLEDPAAAADINVRGLAVMLEAARAAGVPHFVFASSSSVYGERPQGPFKETDRVDHPVSPYAATKKAGELLCHSFAHAFGTSVVALRFFTVYGPRQRPEMAIAAFARALAAGAPLKVLGDGSARRDFTYIDDVVDGVVRAIDRPGGCRIYNLGRGETVTVMETIRALEETMGRKAVLEFGPGSRGDVSLTSADIARARHELGYAPRVSLREGVARYVAWLRAQGERA